MTIRQIFVVTLCLLCITACLIVRPPQIVFAQAPSSSAKAGVLVIIVDRLAFEDFIQFDGATRTLARLIEQGSVGLMNVRTLSANDSKNGYASLASGTRAQVGTWAGHAFMADEHVLDVNVVDFYTGITGKRPTDPIIHVGVGEFHQTPSMADLFGAIGQQMLDSHMQTAVVGNSDTADSIRRLGTLFSMNRAGTIPLGDIGPTTTLYDESFPGGMRTDYDALYSYVDNLAYEADLIVVDLGDLARMEQNLSFTDPPHATVIRQQSLERIGTWVERVLSNPSLSGRLVTLISPSPSLFIGRAGIGMTPVIQWRLDQSNLVAHGQMLTSPTTRRKGIVTNTDFVPTLFNHFGINYSGPGGRVWYGLDDEAPLQHALTMYEKIKAVHLQRLPIIQPYFFGILAIYGIAGTILIINAYFRRLNHRYVQAVLPAWRFILTTFLSYPIALLLLGPLPPMPLLMTAMAIIGLMLALSWIAYGIQRRTGVAGAGIIAILTKALLTLDIVLGASMMQGSLLGYDPVSGSRYYGIGNEYMGVLIGSSLIGTGFLLDRLKLKTNTASYVPSLLLLALAIIMIHPQLGINVGGAITALFAGAAAYVFSRDASITWKNTLFWTTAVVVIIAGTALLDSFLLRDHTSHLGRTVQTISGGDNTSLWTLFGRKIAVNIRLIRLTIWSRVVFLALTFLGGFLFFPNRFGQRVHKKHPALFAMCKVAFIGAIIALAVNDSGVVAAATCLLWPTLALLSIGFDRQRKTPLDTAPTD